MKHSSKEKGIVLSLQSLLKCHSPNGGFSNNLRALSSYSSLTWLSSIARVLINILHISVYFFVCNLSSENSTHRVMLIRYLLFGRE